MLQIEWNGKSFHFCPLTYSTKLNQTGGWKGATIPNQNTGRSWVLPWVFYPFLSIDVGWAKLQTHLPQPSERSRDGGFVLYLYIRGQKIGKTAVLSYRKQRHARKKGKFLRL